MNTEIRPAQPNDIPDLAKLQVIASDGVVDAIYHDLIPGKPVHEILEPRYHRVGTTVSYENCWVATLDGKVVGALHAYPLDAMADDPPDPLVPEERYAVADAFDHLDPAAAGTFHINVVALYPEFRGRGIGSALIAQARTLARLAGFDRLSLAVFEENTGALRLYHRLGFEEAARHRAPEHPLVQLSGDLLMLLGRA